MKSNHTRGLATGAYSPWARKTTVMETLLHVSETEERHTLSFWDSQIVASAHEAGAERILVGNPYL